MLNVSEIATSTEERVLTGVKVGQAMVLDSLKNTIAFADRVVPEQVTDRIEGRVADIPSATPVVDGIFDFYGKLLEAQRDFATELVAVLQPAAAKPAKKAAAKKSTKKAA